MMRIVAAANAHEDVDLFLLRICRNDRMIGQMLIQELSHDAVAGNILESVRLVAQHFTPEVDCPSITQLRAVEVAIAIVTFAPDRVMQRIEMRGSRRLCQHIKVFENAREPLRATMPPGCLATAFGYIRHLLGEILLGENLLSRIPRSCRRWVFCQRTQHLHERMMRRESDDTHSHEPLFLRAEPSIGIRKIVAQASDIEVSPVTALSDEELIAEPVGKRSQTAVFVIKYRILRQNLAGITHGGTGRNVVVGTVSEELELMSVVKE